MISLFRKREGFKGGLELDTHKLHGEAGKIHAAALPSRVVLPVSQHIGAPAKPEVEIGDAVKRGQVIANSDSFISAPVHASISGTVTAIETRPVPHPSGLEALVIEIESDGRDEVLADVGWPACKDPFSLDAGQVRERVRAAGLVGLGGAAFPSAVKLNPGRDTVVDTLIINGAECEPYISCDAALMRERAEEVVSGAEVVRRSLQAATCVIGLEDNAVEAAQALRDAINRFEFCAISVRVVATRYPQGGEKQLIQTLTGHEVPSEGLPLDIGIVVHNVGTVRAIWRALRYAEPLTSRIVTVTGPGIAKPQNMEVRLGTPVIELIAQAGGTTAQHTRLIMGGPMMGFLLPNDQVPVVKATNCLLVDTHEPEPADAAMPCIRCGECVDVCPASLLPQQLYWHARAKEFDKAQDLHLFDCIECGCCAQVCPSHIPLVQYYRYAKTEIYQTEQEKRKADIARGRHEFRQERLEREAQAKEEARRRKREALKQQQAQKPAVSAPAETAQSAPNDAVAAAIAKAKAKRAQAEGGATNAAADALAKARAAAAKAQTAPKETSETKADKPVSSVAAEAIAKAKAAKAAANPAADAIAKAKAKAAQDQSGAAAEAIAKAKARASNKQAETPDLGSSKNNPAADAIAKAKAAAAKKEHSPKPSEAPTDDPVAAAIAKAKAAKARREKSS